MRGNTPAPAPLFVQMLTVEKKQLRAAGVKLSFVIKITKWQQAVREGRETLAQGGGTLPGTASAGMVAAGAAGAAGAGAAGVGAAGAAAQPHLPPHVQQSQPQPHQQWQSGAATPQPMQPSPMQPTQSVPHQAATPSADAGGGGGGGGGGGSGGPDVAGLKKLFHDQFRSSDGDDDMAQLEKALSAAVSWGVREVGR